MATLRKLFFWLHLTAGVTAGVIILLMSVTGVLLTYERQLTEWANADLKVTPSANETRLPLGVLLAKAAEGRDGPAPSGAVWKADATAAVVVNFGREGWVYVNPYTGAVLGEGAKGLREFFQFTTELHRWLALQGEQRPLGKGITGACNLAFLFLVLSGIYLWSPRSWRWKSVKAVLFFEPKLRGKMRDFNWHNVLGFWASIPLVIIVASGSVMSYPWANDLLFRAAGSQPPPRPAVATPGLPAGGGEQREGGRGGATNLDAVSALADRTAQYTANWRSITLRLPNTFVIEQSHRGRPDQKVTLKFDVKTGALTGEETFASLDRGRQWRLWSRWLHTGEAGGILGQTIAGLASAAGAFLVVTGLGLAARRFAAWRRRSRKTASPTTALDQPEEEPASWA
jgi:uncharacterized iron-regulated membrane protein